MGDWYAKQTIGLLPERAARQWGPREALAFQGRRWTFAEMHARVDAVAKGLLSLGIAPGDKVALWMVNRPEWIDAMFAVIKIGAVLVPVNTRFRTEDMAYVLAQSDAAAVLLAGRSGPVDYLGMMREVVPALGSRPDPRFPCLRHAVVLSDRAEAGAADWREVLDRGTSVTAETLRERAARVDPEDSAFMLLHLGDDRVSQGGRAQPPDDPERLGSRRSHGPDRERRDRHVPAALPRLRLHRGAAHVDDPGLAVRC